MIDINTNIQPAEILKKLDLANQQIPLKIDIPDDFYQNLLEQLLERNYLENTGDMRFYNSNEKRRIHWLQITRLPIHPNENESYDLLSRWQGVLSTLHAWGYRLYFLLLRHDGKTKIFLGTSTDQKDISAEEAVEQLREAAFGSMPGMGLRVMQKGIDVYDEINLPLQQMNAIGAVTGIPSFKQTEQKNLLQTLDQLAFGIRDYKGNEKNYAMLVIADPINDSEVTEIISRHRRLSSQIHSAVKMSGGKSASKSETEDPNALKRAGYNALGTIIGTIGGSMLGRNGMITGSMIGSQIANTLTSNLSRPIQYGGGASVNYEYLDKFAEFAETATDHHIKRMNEGRNFGFWNTGIYVLGDMARDVVTVSGMLRSIYSGEETYFEPIRLHLFNTQSGAMEVVRNNFDLLPMVDIEHLKKYGATDRAKEQWHLFGKHYQYLSTPMNTRELSLATSLPRRDVPGLRFVKTAVRFANNPAEVAEDKITIGNIVDTGVVQETSYDIDVNSLVRHALVSGSTGSGKSTTCKRIISEVLRRDIPIMVIEPAKDDYVRWAVEMNKHLPSEKQFKIFMPGVTDVDGVSVKPLHLNPFEPAAIKGAPLDLLQHSETFTTLLNACLPAEEVVPILIEETVHKTITDFAEGNNLSLEADLTQHPSSYPDVIDLLSTAKDIMRHKDYASMNKDNLTEVLITRFRSLTRGMRGKILNARKSVDFDELFSSNVIINISRLASSKDKALIMSLLLQSMYEYRISCYTNDSEYRLKAQQNKLMHLALIEEAHNVLLKPLNAGNSGDPQRAAADLFSNMLSEVRGYGQGFIVVDQVPTRLIDDVIKNTNYKIVHRLTAPDDQEVMASCMAFRDDQKYIIPALEKGNAIICGDEDDAASWVRIPLPTI